MGRNLDPIWIDTFFFYNGKKTTVSNIQHPFGKLSLLFKIECHDSHVDMKTKNRNMLPKMWSKQWSTNNVFSSSLGNNRQDLLKIPTEDHGFPTKDLFGCMCIIQLHRAQRCIISASSQMIRSPLCTNLATFICYVMLQVDSSCRLIRILNFEWAVLPPRRSKNVIPVEATTSTILPCLRRWDRSVVQTNVLPIPPLPYRNNNLPSLFVTTFKIVLYALADSSLSLSSTLFAFVVNEC